MKRFRFSLRSVAVLRAHQEMRAREIFAAAVQRFVQAEEKLEAARARAKAAEAALKEGRLGSFRAADAANYLAAYRRDCAGETAAERAMLEAQVEMARRRVECIQAHQKLQSLQRLEEKARMLHRQEANRIEQAEFDEFAGRRGAMRESFTP